MEKDPIILKNEEGFLYFGGHWRGNALTLAANVIWTKLTLVLCGGGTTLDWWRRNFRLVVGERRTSLHWYSVVHIVELCRHHQVESQFTNANFLKDP